MTTRAVKINEPVVGLGGVIGVCSRIAKRRVEGVISC